MTRFNSRTASLSVKLICLQSITKREKLGLYFTARSAKSGGSLKKGFIGCKFANEDDVFDKLKRLRFFVCLISII